MDKNIERKGEGRELLCIIDLLHVWNWKEKSERNEKKLAPISRNVECVKQKTIFFVFSKTLKTSIIIQAYENSKTY